MNYGRYFEFDFESSKLDAGVAVFNYRWLQDRPQDKVADKHSPRYPIYLTFTSDSIVFNLHYREDGNYNKTGKAVHYHNPIIELVLSPNMEIADGLTESLNETYLSEFPVKGNKYLRKMIFDAYEKDTCEKDKYNTDDNYSSLEFYDVETKEKYEDVEAQKDYEKESTHFLRKVILDFLFDFEFTGVFKNLAFYNEVSIKLKENFLFSALSNKLRYYYLRMRLIRDEVIDIINDNSKGDSNYKEDEQLQFLFQRYELAEHEWVESILQPKAMKAFHESPWFNECHEELEQVYSVCRLKKLRKQDEKKKAEIEEINKAESFCTQVRNVMKEDSYGDKITEDQKKEINPLIEKLEKKLKTRNLDEILPAKENLEKVFRPIITKILKKANPRILLLNQNGISQNNAFGLTVSNLLGLIHKKQSPKSKKKEVDSFDVFGRAVYSHYETARIATKWEVEHFRLWGVIKVWCGDKKTIGFSMCALILALAILLVINHWINNNGENLMNSGWKFIVLTAVGVVLLVTFRWLMRKMRRSTWGLAIPTLLMPRLLAAIVAAWFTMCMSEEVFLKLSLPDFNWSAAFIVFAITIAFIIYESYMVNPFDSKWHHIISSLFIFILAYAYAFATGTLIYDYFGQNFLSVYMDELRIQGIEYQLQRPLEGNFNLYIHGKELLEKADNIMCYKIRYRFIAQISFFATFIGIFLQLMLQGVSITKSSE